MKGCACRGGVSGAGVGGCGGLVRAAIGTTGRRAVPCPLKPRCGFMKGALGALVVGKGGPLELFRAHCPALTGGRGRSTLIEED
jgi:hypothetical protein